MPYFPAGRRAFPAAIPDHRKPALSANRRWVVNVAAVFGGIHFYTQWFERLGATALSVLLAGLLMLAFGFGLWMLNQRWRGTGTPAAA
jgi:hypothetical protein